MADTGKWDPKDPDEVKDYEFDWTDILKGDTISGTTWTISPSGLTKDSDTNNSSTTTIWVSGGTAGVTYSLMNEITTAGGRKYNRTRKLKMKEL